MSDTATATAAPASTEPAKATEPAGTVQATATPASQEPVQQSLLGKQDATTTGDAAKTAEAAPAKAEPTPQELALKIPDGFEVAPPVLEKFKTTAKELGLDSPKAQKLLDMYAEQSQASVSGFEEKANQAWMDQRKAWVEEVKADKELGGVHFDKSLALAHKAVQFAGGDDLRKVFDQLGLGDHPALFRAFVKFGQRLAEDKLSMPGSGPPGQLSENEKLRQQFPSMFNEDGSPKF